MTVSNENSETDNQHAKMILRLTKNETDEDSSVVVSGTASATNCTVESSSADHEHAKMILQLTASEMADETLSVVSITRDSTNGNDGDHISPNSPTFRTIPNDSNNASRQRTGATTLPGAFAHGGNLVTAVDSADSESVHTDHNTVEENLPQAQGVVVDDPVEAEIFDLRKILRKQLARVLIGVAVVVGLVVPLAIVLPDDGDDPADVVNFSPTASPTATNIVCDRAVALMDGESPFLGGINQDSAIDESIAELCPNVKINAPGVWYSTVGTGAIFEANVCTRTDFTIDPAESFNVSVFSGACSALRCVDAFEEDSSHDLCGRMSWQSELGTTYYIYAWGESSEESFEIEIVSRHDVCEGALGPIVLGKDYHGTADGGEDESPLVNGSTRRGAWYLVEGTGNILEATACTGSSIPSFTFDSQIRVFAGSCGNLTFLQYNDNHTDPFCGPMAHLLWNSTLGEVYRIYVTGRGAEVSRNRTTADFALKVRTFNDKCEDAAGPLEIGSVETGMTFNATLDDIPACGDATETRAAGVWYTTIGTGEWLIATTCTSLPLNGDFDTQITVLEGDCDGTLNCVAGDDDGTSDCGSESEVKWFSIKGQTYYILVHGWDDPWPQNRGFGLELRNAVNDRCQLTLDHLQPDSVVQGNTEDARNTIDTIPDCESGFDTFAGGLWWSFIGTQERHFISVNSELDQIFQIWVFHGSCDSLECVTVGRDEASWDSVLGREYFVHVNGLMGQVGRFTMNMRSQEATPNPNATVP